MLEEADDGLIKNRQIEPGNPLYCRYDKSETEVLPVEKAAELAAAVEPESFVSLCAVLANLHLLLVLS